MKLGIIGRNRILQLHLEPIFRILTPYFSKHLGKKWKEVILGWWIILPCSTPFPMHPTVACEQMFFFFFWLKSAQGDEFWKTSISSFLLFLRSPDIYFWNAHSRSYLVTFRLSRLSSIPFKAVMRKKFVDLNPFSPFHLPLFFFGSMNLEVHWLKVKQTAQFGSNQFIFNVSLSS